jgi:5-methylcytosine-specific restriction enzyme subunit McrC
VKRDGETALVIDTKWKRLAPILDDPKQGVSQADIYQMMAYGRLYRCRRLILLYPHHAGLRAKAGLQSRHRIVSTDDELLIVTVNLAGQEGTIEQLHILQEICGLDLSRVLS